MMTNYLFKNSNTVCSFFFKQHHLTLPKIITFTSGEELLSYTGSIDILFLDIEMPGMNGIYIGNVLKERNKNIIIFVVTSYSEYLDEAMRFHVFRYLSKPLEKQRLFRNLKDALAVYHTLSQKIALETKKEETLTLPVNDIILIETQGRKITLSIPPKKIMNLFTVYNTGLRSFLKIVLFNLIAVLL